MASFNSRQYIGDAIQSITDQSFSDFEFIIVDDGSLDGGAEIAFEFARRDGRIKVVHQEHSGLISALNKGCNLAKGKYIARLDSDDLARPQRLEQQVRYLQDGNAVLLGGGVECIDGEGKNMFGIKFPGWEQGLRSHLLVNCYMAHTTVMFRRDVFLSLGGYRSHYEVAEDYDLYLRMSDKHIVDNLQTILCQYRLHSDQISVRKVSQQVISAAGARLAAWARRSDRAEPEWSANVVTREDLIACGMRGEVLDALVSRHRDITGNWNMKTVLEAYPQATCHLCCDT
jgi:glycosyltransferase involved in cell wall biosynthesis